MEHWTTEKIIETTMRRVAPLPSQQAYAQALASIFSMHIHRNQLIDDGIPADELPAPSAIVVAPTGQGKTFLVRKMAECLDLNVITVDCSTLSAEGWRGISLSQRLAAASKEAKDERHFAQSILFMDEIDKLRLWGSSYDQGNAMVNILQLFNNGTVAVEIDKKDVNIDVNRFTVLFGGAFEGLDKIIQERVCPKSKIGFGSTDTGEKLSKTQLMQCVTHEDLSKFGLMPELLGRIGTILTIPPLELEDYRQLLNAEAGSLRRKYHNYLSHLYGATFEITGTGVEAIAQKCMKSSAGARAVTPLVNDLMRSAIMSVENEDTICKVVLDADEDGCFIRYEHGLRAYAFRNPARVEHPDGLPWHVVRAKNLPTLTRKLIRYFRHAEGYPDVIPQLEAFLNMTLTYLYLKCPREFDFDSLEKLARATYRDPVSSAFDTIMRDARAVIPFSMYRTFDAVYSPGMKQNLVSSLMVIAAYIQEHHNPCRIRFEVPKKNRD